VPPDLVIGRRGEIQELERRLREGLSTMMVGPRRAGKTTVCEAVCAALADDHFIVNLEVPVRQDARALLQLGSAGLGVVGEKSLILSSTDIGAMFRL